MGCDDGPTGARGGRAEASSGARGLTRVAALCACAACGGGSAAATLRPPTPPGPVRTPSPIDCSPTPRTAAPRPTPLGLDATQRPTAPRRHVEPVPTAPTAWSASRFSAPGRRRHASAAQMRVRPLRRRSCLRLRRLALRRLRVVRRRPRRGSRLLLDHQHGQRRAALTKKAAARLASARRPSRDDAADIRPLAPALASWPLRYVSLASPPAGFLLERTLQTIVEAAAPVLHAACAERFGAPSTTARADGWMSSGRQPRRGSTGALNQEIATRQWSASETPRPQRACILASHARRRTWCAHRRRVRPSEGSTRHRRRPLRRPRGGSCCPRSRAWVSGSVFYRGIEDPQSVVLRVEWESLDAHMRGFRESPLLR